MLRNYYRQLLAFIFIITSIAANAQSFGTSTSARYGDGCRLDFYNSTNVKIFSLRGSELRYTYNLSGQIIVRDENTQITDVFGISGLAALIDSVQSVCLAGLCSGGSTPVENFAYCGSAVASYFWKNDTSNNEGVFYAINTFFVDITDSLQSIEFVANSNSICCGDDTTQTYTNYPYQGQIGLAGGCEKQWELYPFECDSIISFSATFNDTAFVEFAYADCVMGGTYGIDTISISTTEFSEFKYQWITLNSDTSVVLDYMIRANGTSGVCWRPLGVNITDLDLDSIGNIITITSNPSKRANVIYAASSFKIEKIAFADITAGTISGSSYNPNSGTQSNTFNLTTGKNTFRVSVEDTDGNIAYSIFQLTKTAL